MFHSIINCRHGNLRMVLLFCFFILEAYEITLLKDKPPAWEAARPTHMGTLWWNRGHASCSPAQSRAGPLLLISICRAIWCPSAPSLLPIAFPVFHKPLTEAGSLSVQPHLAQIIPVCFSRISFLIYYLGKECKFKRLSQAPPVKICWWLDFCLKCTTTGSRLGSARHEQEAHLLLTAFSLGF